MITEAEFRTSILPFTLREEGGLSTDPHDDGNWSGGAAGKGVLRGTKNGISAKAHTTLDIRHITIAQAGAIYWDGIATRPTSTASRRPCASWCSMPA